mmetsp:Transcript_84186/g.132557  ORF Transcript_84186/g.132557 Transcript_84186/m.132557 type:complete len:236 (-) Transcript_84186:19-726(-)
MAMFAFAIISLLQSASTARIHQHIFSRGCTPVMAKWICQAGVVDENSDCVTQLCNSKAMANYKNQGEPHPYRDKCCEVAGLQIPVSVSNEAEDLSENLQSDEPENLAQPVTKTHLVFQKVEIQPRVDKTFDKAFYAPKRVAGLSWAMTCISLCEATEPNDSHESSCQAIQSLEDCEAATKQKGINLIVPTTESGKKLFSKYPAGCLVPQDKDFAIWNAPMPGKGIVVNNICASYK